MNAHPSIRVEDAGDGRTNLCVEADGPERRIGIQVRLSVDMTRALIADLTATLPDSADRPTPAQARADEIAREFSADAIEARFGDFVQRSTPEVVRVISEEIAAAVAVSLEVAGFARLRACDPSSATAQQEERPHEENPRRLPPLSAGERQ